MSTEPAPKPKTEADLLAQNERTLIELTHNVMTSRRALLEKLIDPKGRDLDDDCGYPDQITPKAYRKLYDREGIAARVVEVLPDETWSTPPQVYETENPKHITAFEDAVERLQKQLNIWGELHRLDIMSRIGHFGVMLLGFGDGKALDQPVAGVTELGPFDPFAEPDEESEEEQPTAPAKPPRKPPGTPKTATGEEGEDDEDEVVRDPQFIPKVRLLFLRSFDESLVEVLKWEVNDKSPRFGQPLMYKLKFVDFRVGTDGTTSLQTVDRTVHWTRVLHRADGKKSSTVYGTPAMQPVWNRLVDLRKLLGGSAEMFWKGGFPGYSFEINPELAAEGTVQLDTAKVREEFQNFSNRLQRYMALTGVTAKSLAPQVADPKPHVETQLQAIAITIGVPMRVFMGSEEGKLAAGQDATRDNRRIKRRQEEDITPDMVRPFFGRLIEAGVLPKPVELFVDWDDLHTPSDLDKAQVAERLTNSLAKYVSGGVAAVIEPLTFLTLILGLDQEEAEAAMRAAEEFVGAGTDGSTPAEELLKEPEPPPGFGGDEEGGDDKGSGKKKPPPKE